MSILVLAGVMERDSARPFCARGRSGDQLSFWASEHLGQARRGSPKRECRVVVVLCASSSRL